MKRKLFIIVGIVIVLTIGLSVRQYSRLSAETVVVENAPAEKNVIARASIVPEKGVAEVRTRIDGIVLQVHVREGDKVEKGQLLAEIEGDILEEQLNRIQAEHRSLSESAIGIAKGARRKEKEAIEAQLEAAKEELTMAKEQAQRQKKLYDAGSASSADVERTERNVSIRKAKVDFESARLALARSGGNPHEAKAAEARAVAAKSAIALAEKQLAWTKIVAPIDGVVLARRVDPGDTVAVTAGFASPALFEVADIESTEVRLEVEEKDVHKIKKGQKVEVLFPGGNETYGVGRVVRMGARVVKREIGGDPANIRADSLVLPVFVKIEEGNKWELPIGQRLEARIGIRSASIGNRLPREAVAIRDGAAWVEIREGFQRKAKRVEFVLADNKHVQLKGLKPGTRVYLQR